MTDPPTSPSLATERAELRTLRERRRRVWRSMLFVIVVTLVLVVLSKHNRDDQALRSCRQRMQYAVRVFQERQDKGEHPLSLLPLPEDSARADDAERSRLLAWRDHTLYNTLYSERLLFSRQIGVCCCMRPHSRLFQPAGRHVVIFDVESGTYTLAWMDESEFERRAPDLGLRVPEAP